MTSEATAGLMAMMLASCAASTATSPAHTASTDLGAGSFEAVVVGTIDKSHLTEPGYPLSQLAALIEGYQPDLVLVEIRPEPFRQGHYEDGPFEMTYVTWLVQKQGSVVAPIDWFREADVGREPEPEAGDKQAFEAETKALEAQMKWPLTFDEVHSAQQDATLLATLNIQARYLGGNSTWNQRQAWFHHQAIQAIRQHRAHRVMAFVGAYHRPELERFLAAQGGSVRSPRSVSAPRGGSAKVPPPVVQLWRDGAERMKAQAEKVSGKLAEALKAKAVYFQVAADHDGECCVDSSAFQATPAK